MCAWVNTLCQQLSRGIPALACLGKCDGGVGAQAQHLGLALESVAKAPELPASGRHLKTKAQGVSEAIELVAGFGGADGGICERHGYSLAVPNRAGLRSVCE